jgi:ketosteroid isomerase-like protein
MKNEKTSIFGNIGITAFMLKQSGMLVDSQTYTGQHITIDGRATFVLIKEDTWKIIHYHLDKIFN